MSVLMWFRNDLRTTSNLAFNSALQKHCQHAVFFVCKSQWQSHDMANIKVDFIERRINALGLELANLGVKLHVIHSDMYSNVPFLLKDLCDSLGVEQVFATREPEWNEKLRDNDVANQSIKLCLYDDDCILPYGSVLNAEGQMFKVFTPFKRRWLMKVKELLPLNGKFSGLECTQPIEYKPINFSDIKGMSNPWVVESGEIDRRLNKYIREQVFDYAQYRDIPSMKATSGISPYLAIGAVSAKTCLRRVLEIYPMALDEADSGASVWISELIWRDFYRHLMVAYPNLSKRKSFKPKYDELRWPNSGSLFQAWSKGETGFPIIDAAMRQLIKTGWMHNRLRMIVASFLTKHCLVDWRLGEKFFMRHLIDGDLSANNGGWQWAASSGADSVPYFRIFNPITQSKKFDPKGVFIRKYIKELDKVPDKAIHEPAQYITENGLDTGYPQPILDLSVARKQALEFYKG